MESKKLPSWQEISLGGMVKEPANTLKLDKSGWRVEKPVINQDACIRCRLCWIYCPDSAIIETEEEYVSSKGKKYNKTYKINYNLCKGCGICSEECPVNAIKMVPEEVM